MKRLVDGESKEIKPARHVGEYGVAVVAHRKDSETPYVVIRIKDSEVSLTDVDATDLADRLYRALSILPSSK